MRPTRNTLDPARLPPTLTPAMMAEITGLNVVTIRYKAKSGEIEAKKLGRKWIIPRREVEKYL